MKHRASAKFWRFYEQLPADIQDLANKNFVLLKSDPSHGSLNFKKVGQFWSARVGIHYRAVAIEEHGTAVWFWIGRHDHYDRLIGKRK